MACSNPSSWNVYSSGGTVGTFGTAQVTDPVQCGMLNNCSLIAAFASLAWKLKIGTQAGPNYAFTFYGSIAETQKTDQILPLDATGKLMYAKSDTPTEIWPALYEKAYYQWLEKLGLNNLSGRPNYCAHTGWQSPVTLLSQLTGKTVIQKSCRSFQTANAVFSDIDNGCVNFNPIATNRTIRTPAVAWTYDPNVSNPNNVTYSGTTIAGQHTYSLLGVTGTKSGTTWTQKYIVLRNPYGKSTGDPVMSTGELYTGSWCNIILGGNDGIFALRHDLFWKYFEGYAWI